MSKRKEVKMTVVSLYVLNIAGIALALVPGFSAGCHLEPLVWLYVCGLPVLICAVSLPAITKRDSPHRGWRALRFVAIIINLLVVTNLPDAITNLPDFSPSRSLVYYLPVLSLVNLVVLCALRDNLMGLYIRKKILQLHTLKQDLARDVAALEERASHVAPDEDDSTGESREGEH